MKGIYESLITVDDTGMPKAPDVKQLVDKDVRELWYRDKSSNKQMYIKQAGIIYYLADPKSPTNQAGLSEAENLRHARENFDLPSTYEPDALVWKIIEKYKKEKLGVAGRALMATRQAIHNATLAVLKLNELLNEKLKDSVSLDDAKTIIDIMDNLNKKVAQISDLTKALNTAIENFHAEETEQIARGGVTILSSQIEE